VQGKEEGKGDWGITVMEGTKGGGELQGVQVGCSSWRSEGEGDESRPRGGREYGRLRLIRGRPPHPSPSFPILFYPSPLLLPLVSLPRPFVLGSRLLFLPLLLHLYVAATSRIHCALPALVLFLSAAISCPFGSPLISIVANSTPRRPTVSVATFS